MDTLNVLQQILNFFWLTLPYIFLGFFVANLIKASPYLDLIGLPMSYIARAAHLPKKCSAIFSFYLLNSYSALGMMSENYKEKNLKDKEIIITVLVAYFPKSINSVTFFLAPVALSVFGIWIGGSILAVEFLICFGIAIVGIIAGRILFDPDTGSGKNPSQNPDPAPTPPRENMTWIGTLKHCFIDSVKGFYEIAIVLIPTGAIIILLFNIGVRDMLASFLNPLLSSLNLPASSIIVYAAAFMSQVAAIAAIGTIAVAEDLTVLQCLLIYVISRAIHLGIGQIKSGFPTNVALFGKTLGFKVSAIDFCMLQGATVITVILLIFVGGA